MLQDLSLGQRVADRLILKGDVIDNPEAFSLLILNACGEHVSL